MWGCQSKDSGRGRHPGVTSTAPAPSEPIFYHVPWVSQAVSCPGWGLILDLIIYEWALVPTSDFPPDDRAQVRLQVWVVFLQLAGTTGDGSVRTHRVKTDWKGPRRKQVQEPGSS